MNGFNGITNDFGKRTFQGPQLEALVCKDCGSQFFYPVELKRYSASAYSSMAGGDMQPIGDMTHSIRVCICSLRRCFRRP